MGRLQLHWERATKAVHQIPRSKTPQDHSAKSDGENCPQMDLPGTGEWQANGDQLQDDFRSRSADVQLGLSTQTDTASSCTPSKTMPQRAIGGVLSTAPTTK